MGFHGGCAAMWPLEEIVAVPGGPGQRGRGRLLGEELPACMPKRLPSSGDHSALRSSASKSRGGKKWVIFLQAVCKVKQQEESWRSPFIREHWPKVHVQQTRGILEADSSPAVSLQPRDTSSVGIILCVPWLRCSRTARRSQIYYNQIINTLWAVGLSGGRMPGTVKSTRNWSRVGRHVMEPKWETITMALAPRVTHCQ